MENIHLKALVKRCVGEFESIGIKVPSDIKYRVSGRMTKVLGNCSQTWNRLGMVTDTTITLSRDLPVEMAHHTLAHELVHAIVGVRAGHGYEFKRLASEVNRKLGYNIGTYANAEEAQAIREVRASKINTVTIKCNSCGSTSVVNSNRKAVRNLHLYKCRLCGGSLSKE